MKDKANKPIELGKFSNQLNNEKKEVLTGTNITGAPADNYSSGDIGKRKSTKSRE